MAFYSLLMFGKIYGEVWQNQYNYMSSAIGDVTDGAEDLNIGFDTNLKPKLQAMWRDDEEQFTIEGYYTVDVFNEDDFKESLFIPPFTGTNGLSGDAVSPFLTFSFRTDRWRVGRNRGYKRYSGICEGDVGGNVYDPGGTVLADMAAVLGGVLVGTEDAYTPVIAGKQKYVPDPEQPTKFAYKYYPTELEQRTASSGRSVWSPYRLTTQRSRIEGQGA